MLSMLDFVRGRWSSAAPGQPGTYMVRVPGSQPWVAYCDGDALAGSESDANKAPREYFYLEGDTDGQPTRWDDRRVAQIAEANGWRDRRSTWT